MQARVRLTTFLSLIFLLCLNTMPGLDLNEPINWDEIGEFEGEVHELNYDYVWDDGNEGNHRDFSLFFFVFFHCTSGVLIGNDTADSEDNNDQDEDGQGEGDGNTAEAEAVHGEPEAVHGEPEAGSGAHTVQQVQGAASVQQVEEAGYVPQADAGDEADVVAFDSGTPLHALIILFLFLCMQS